MWGVTDERPPLARDEHPQIACPHCGAQFGRPVSVSTRKDDQGVMDIKMGCKDCNHTWIVQKLTHDNPPA